MIISKQIELNKAIQDNLAYIYGQTSKFIEHPEVRETFNHAFDYTALVSYGEGYKAGITFAQEIVDKEFRKVEK